MIGHRWRGAVQLFIKLEVIEPWLRDHFDTSLHDSFMGRNTLPNANYPMITVPDPAVTLLP
jgi:hypothetical protein